MGARGKQSGGALTVVQVAELKRPEPWQALSKPEAEQWRAIVDSLPPEYFRPSDLPLLAAYCQAVVRHAKATKQLAKEPQMMGVTLNPLLRIIDMSLRQMAQLAGKLRICPSSRYDKTKAHTLGKPGASGAAKPWEREKIA